MAKRKIAQLLTLLLLATAPARAQVPHGRWEKVERLRPGTGIRIRLIPGDRIQGTFKSIDTDSIVLTEETNRDRRIPKFLVKGIESTVKQPDRLCNGALIGALAGIGIGVGSMIAYGNAKTAGPVHWGSEDGPAYILGAVMVGGGIGAAVGALVDSGIHHPQLLYAK